MRFLRILSISLKKKNADPQAGIGAYTRKAPSTENGG